MVVVVGWWLNGLAFLFILYVLIRWENVKKVDAWVVTTFIIFTIGSGAVIVGGGGHYNRPTDADTTAAYRVYQVLHEFTANTPRDVASNVSRITLTPDGGILIQPSTISNVVRYSYKVPTALDEPGAEISGSIYPFTGWCFVYSRGDVEIAYDQLGNNWSTANWLFGAVTCEDGVTQFAN